MATFKEYLTVSIEQPMFDITDRFNVGDMQALMRHPSIYWSASDALSPKPEEMDFVAHLTHPDTWTVAGRYKGYLIGYVQFVKRTSVGAEIHTGFLPGFRGRV